MAATGNLSLFFSSEGAKRAGPLAAGAPPRSYVFAVFRPGGRSGRASRPRPWCFRESLLDYLGDDSRADGAATLADGEPQTLIHGDRLDQLDRHLDVVTRHDHLRPLGEVGDTGHVGGAEIELRSVA